MTTAHRPLTKFGRSRLLMTAVFLALVASLTVATPGFAGHPGTELHIVIETGEVSEGDDGTTNMPFTVKVDEGVAPDEDIVFEWKTVAVTDPATDAATPDEDYVTVEQGEGTGTIKGHSASTDPTDPSFEEGDTDTTIYVEVNGDLEIEPDEKFEVHLTAVTSGNAVIKSDGGTAEGTITNDDPKASVANAEVAEGGTAEVTVTLSVPAQELTEIGYQTEAPDASEGGASAGDDYEDTYEGTTATVEIAPGEQQATITVDTFEDDIAENEHFLIVLQRNTGDPWFEGDIEAEVEILDPEPRVWISDVTQKEGHSGFTHFVFDVHVDLPADEDVTVAYETGPTDDDDDNDATEDDDGELTAGEDYLGKDSTLTFLAGSDATKTITVQVKGDTAAESEDPGQVDETFAVKLSWPNPETAPNVSLDDPGVGTIVGDDNPTVNITDKGVAEGADGESPTLGIPVELVDDDEDDPQPLPAGKDIVLEYWTEEGGDKPATPDGEDVDDADYQPIDSESPATVTIPAGETTGTLPVTVFGDDVEEDGETFTVTIDEPEDNSNPDLTINEDAKTAVGTIEDDDGTPTITIGDAEKVEGSTSSAVRHMEFPVRLSHPSDDEVTVEFNTDDGTAREVDDDYQLKTGTLTFVDHETEKTVVINIVEDTKPEANETFVVRLTEPVNGEFADGAERIEGTGTIVNDDGPGVSVGDVSVDEGDSGTGDAVFRITAETTDHDGFTVDAATADDTATAGSDYTALKTTTLTFDAGESTATVAIPVRGDTDHEDDETFTLQLSNANFAVIADGQGVATIVNDDEAPVDDGDGDDGGSGGDDDGTGDDSLDLGEISRSAGATRIETALQVSRDHWDQAPDVVLANAATFPDALAGGTLSALLDAPLLLTFPDDLSDGVAGELDRLGAQSVWILGGSAAVSVEIQQQLLDAGFEVHRFFGEDRFATAAEIARGTGPSQAGEVVLALGAHDDPDRAWPDALSAGALAAVPDPLPVLLTTTDSLPGATTSALSDLQATTVYLLGGTAAISEDVEAQLVGLGYEVVRLAGSSRWGTSVAVATEALRRHGDTGAADVVFATGHNFPDGLAAGALAARLNGLLLLVPTDQLADETAEFLAANALRLDRGVIVGGEKVVTVDVADIAADALVADG